jgi:pilus assembly protein Flp/PilA
MFHHLKNFLCDESGPTAVEYAVMLSLIVAVCLISIRAMSNATAASFDTSAAEIAAVFGS